MEPKDVWVIYNKYTAKILFVYAEEYMAKKKTFYIPPYEYQDNGRTITRYDHTLVITLEKALMEIELADLANSPEERAKQEDLKKLKEECNYCCD